MRLLGTFQSESDAKVLSDYLYLQGIDNKLEPEELRSWNIWIIQESQVKAAREILRLYRNDPDASQFQDNSVEAQKKREVEKQEQEEFRKQVFDRQHLFGGYSIGVLTIILIVGSVGISLISKLGENRELLNYLFITRTYIVGAYLQWMKGFPEIQSGEVWRLLTPIFIHFGILHLLFNMLWLKDLGSMIEGRQNVWILLSLVLIIGVSSNVSQYLVSGPSFGGMSGVVYGLLGYIWIRGHFDPGSGLYASKETVIMMILWFFLCLSGLIGNVANTAHAVGLGMGIVWGFASAHIAMRKR
jgi:GlpG protein